MTTLRNGRYELVRTLGEGTQAETWEALDTGSKATLGNKWESYVSEAKGRAKPSTPGAPAALDPRGRVAIKCFRLGKAKAWKDVELAEREARILKELSHAHLPRYIEHFEEEGALYLVMEKIEGESLATIRARGGGASVADVERMLRDIGEALRYIHGRAPAIVHRDIKPGNILRRPDGSYALVDFGAVRDRLKPSGGSTVVGTFGFMAPEQFQGRASPRSDLYGLAATALVMLTGEEPEDLPHEGLGIDVERAVPRGTPRALVRTLTAMLAPDPDRRAGSVHEALALLKESVPPPAPRKKKKAPAPVPTPRNRKERRAQRLQDRTERRAARHVERIERRQRRAPFLPRTLGRLALLLAWICVWITAGIAAPVLLFLLSLVFGKTLRQAAEACFRGEKRAKAVIGRASRRLSGRLPDGPGHYRVVAGDGEEEERVVRVGSEEENADAWLEERLEGEPRSDEDERAQRERQRTHAQRKHWGR